MDYAKARELLVEHLNVWKPEGEILEVLEKSWQALDDCLEMGLSGEDS